MPTLYVQNVPEELYKALRERARSNGRSVTKEVIAVLSNEIPTKAELKRRKEVLHRLDELRAGFSRPAEKFADSAELLREDRER